MNVFLYQKNNYPNATQISVNKTSEMDARSSTLDTNYPDSESSEWNFTKLLNERKIKKKHWFPTVLLRSCYINCSRKAFHYATSTNSPIAGEHW